MKKKLLVIEDDVATQDVYKLIFELQGYEVELLDDGASILNNTFNHPDIIILDRLLQGTDGLAICRHLKANEATRHIPVIMVSAAVGITYAAREAGAEAGVEKPFSVPKLRELVKQWVNR